MAAPTELRMLLHKEWPVLPQLLKEYLVEPMGVYDSWFGGSECITRAHEYWCWHLVLLRGRQWRLYSEDFRHPQVQDDLTVQAWWAGDLQIPCLWRIGHHHFGLWKSCHFMQDLRWPNQDPPGIGPQISYIWFLIHLTCERYERFDHSEILDADSRWFAWANWS